MSWTVKRMVASLGVGGAAVALAACTQPGEPEPGTVTSVVTSTVAAESPETSGPVTNSTTPTSESPTTSGSPTTQPVDVCDSAAFQRSGSEFVDIVLYCDTQWARAGAAQSDHVVIFRWLDGTWTPYEADGTSHTGFECYDRERLIDNGAPAYFLENALLCEE
ncbi:hypothetical protein A605_13810 [Corynebacterium halotolerans YIM 70093 = DSM 44683]|uniref:Secreted protein n=2 Tax=Corynebacterium halotolerans TaxID=225326 RepID=M1NQV2_9CORY|nr:hypothetical protein A605_13810 [Corynebacterium halotolerans YIM 70093 = DSM 44683]